MLKKSLFTLLLVGSLIALLSSSFSWKHPGGHFKNLKVLPQDISKEQLDSIMDEFKFSLGVKCGFCHARFADTSNHHLDFASDAKDEKLAAREMMKMTKHINGDYFNWMHSTMPDTIHTVRCYTCHRGNKQPESVFPVSK